MTACKPHLDIDVSRFGAMVFLETQALAPTRPPIPESRKRACSSLIHGDGGVLIA
jgi:hypothetical protein